MSSILQDKVKLQEAIEHSNSISDALHYLNLRSAGGNFKSFNVACKKFNLEPPQGWRLKAASRLKDINTIDLNKILVENSTYSNRSQIKKRCYKLGLLKEKCYSCAIGPYWNNKPLTLQLEHKNGIWNDHRIENLEILCPNCHTQTKSYAGKSSKQS